MMKMNEIPLVIAVIVILIVSQLLLQHLRRPMIHYVRIVVGIFLLLLVWLVSGDGSKPIKVIVSAVVVTSVIREILLFKKSDTGDTK